MSEWNEIALKEITTHIKDGTHSTHKRVESGVPLLSAKNIGGDGRLRWDKTDDLVSESDYSAIIATFAPKRGDVLLTVVGSIGRAAIFDGARVAFQRSVAFVRCGDRVLPEFLYQITASHGFTRQLERRCNVTAQAGLYLGELAKCRIRLPPRDKQKKIATILCAIDTAIERSRALIGKYQQIKSGLMYDLFTRGVLPNGQLRPPRSEAPELYQESAVGRIPLKWKVTSLHEVLARIDAGWSPECPEIPPASGEWGVLKVSAVTKGYFDASESKALPPAMRPDTSIEVHEGDVVLTRANGVADLVGIAVQVERTPGRLMLSDKLLRLVPHPSLMTRDFLALLLRTDRVRAQIAAAMSGSSGQRNISQAQLRQFSCAYPDLDEQARIAERLHGIEGLCRRERLVLEKLGLQKLGLMQDLLTGKLPVKVDAPEPAHA